MKRNYIVAIMFFAGIVPACAQRTLTLDSCRAMAMRNNKPLNISKLKQEAAMNTRKAMRTKYLPKVDAVGSYQYFGREISLLSSGQKGELRSMGTTMTAAGGQTMGLIGQGLSNNISGILTGMAQQGMITPQMAQAMGQQLSQMGTQLQGAIGQQMTQTGNALGEKIVKAFDTDTHNIWAGAIMLRQPLFMGGAIKAANNIADITERLATDNLDQKQQATLYDIDQTYWMVVSLKQKEKLAESYRDLVSRLDGDVEKMIVQGVATKADGLRVDVRVNEADMQITQAQDGVRLSKMLLCQLCGLPMSESSNITLADEDKDNLDTQVEENNFQPDSTLSSRPEVRLLQGAHEISQENVKLIRAQYLPHVALTGGYMVSNPNVFNGFSTSFAGTWNVGVTMQIPVWNWFEGRYKVRAAKAAASMAQMELSDVREKIDLQITQSRFRLDEAQKKLRMAENNIKSAEENLRCANIGFKEGVMDLTNVMEAQTAWEQAQSEKIDAEVEVKLSEVNLQKAMGNLR